MAIEKNKKGTLSLNFQHDFITLRTPNGNFTMSYGGAKTSGRLASTPGVFEKLHKHVKTFAGNTGDAMRSLLNEETLAGFWPDWNKTYEMNFEVDDIVSLKGMPDYQNGKIIKLNKVNAKIKFAKCIMSAPYDIIIKA